MFIGIELESPEVVLLPLYNLELLLKLYTFGFRRFVRSAWNWSVCTLRVERFGCSFGLEAPCRHCAPLALPPPQL